MNLAKIENLWQVLDCISAEKSKEEICQQLKINTRQLHRYITTFRKLNIKTTFSRKTERYTIDWSHRQYQIELNHKEFFFLYATLMLHKPKSDSIKIQKDKLKLAARFNPKVFLDLSAGDISNKKISAELHDSLLTISKAIEISQQISFKYQNTKDNEKRTIQPYLIVHSQHSYFVYGFCTDRNDWRFFKIIRMSDLKIMQKKFKQVPHNIERQLETAWYLKANQFGKLYDIRVKFIGEAASAILEYKLHNSQKTISTGAETIIEWQVSELSEFASWLCHWLGNFEVIQPDGLKNLILEKVNKQVKIIKLNNGEINEK